jgi:hypothetical protein
MPLPISRLLLSAEQHYAADEPKRLASKDSK